MALLDRLAGELSDVAIVEQTPLQDGRNMTMMLAPSKAILAGEKEKASDDSNVEQASDDSNVEQASYDSNANSRDDGQPAAVQERVSPTPSDAAA
jgi:translation initiation factor IF-3